MFKLPQLSRYSPTPLRLQIGLSLIATGGYFLALPWPPLRAMIYTCIGLTAITWIGYHLRQSLPTRLAWQYVAAGLVLYFTGDLIYNFYRFILFAPIPFPSIADAFFIGSRIPLIAGIFFLTQPAISRGIRFSSLDTLIVTTGSALLWWAFLMQPIAVNPETALLAKLIAIAYPLSDLLLFAGCIRLAITSPAYIRSTALLGSGLAGLLTADIVYSILQLQGNYEVGTVIDGGWIWFYCGLAAAVTSARQTISPLTGAVAEPPTPPGRSGLRITLLTIATLLFPGIVTLANIVGVGQIDLVTVVLGVILTILVMWRLWKLMAENASLHQKLTLWRSDMLFRVIVQRAFSGVAILDKEMAVKYANPALERRSIIRAGLNYLDFVAPQDKGRFQRFWHDTVNDTGTDASLEYRLKTTNDEWLDVETSSNNLLQDEWIQGVVFITRDISARKRHDAQLRQLAYTDALTGLPNREALQQFLEKTLVKAQRKHRSVAAIFVDLDNFNELNDNLGHTVGDEVLSQLAKRIKHELPENNLVARFGSDEFIIILTSVRDADTAIRIYSRIAETIRRPLIINDHRLHVSASAGIALSHLGQTPPDRLIQNADIALNHAKKRQGNTVKMFSDDLLIQRRQYHDLITALRNELLPQNQAEDTLIGLDIQPIFTLKDQRQIAAITDLRWKHPQHGALRPLDVTDLTHEPELQVELESFCLEQICINLAKQTGQSQSKTILVPTSLVSLNRNHYDQYVLDLLDHYQLPPRSITLCLDERALARDAGAANTQLSLLQEAGVGLAITHFGREFFSFGQLQRLPHANLVLDRSCLSNLDDPAFRIILRHTITLAHQLKRKVIIEGLQTAHEAQLIAELGCDEGFGPLYKSVTAA